MSHSKILLSDIKKEYMTHHLGSFLTVLAALFSLALIVAVGAWAHHDSASQIYGAAVTALHPDNGAATTGANAHGFAITTSAADAEARDSILSAAREGVRWAYSLRCEQTAWCVVILVLMLASVGYHFFLARL